LIRAIHSACAIGAVEPAMTRREALNANSRPACSGFGAVATAVSEFAAMQAGDVVHQRPGIVHYLCDYSPDMEYLEIVGPADFKTVDMRRRPTRCRRDALEVGRRTAVAVNV
jgi:hypothetical protein